MLSALHPDSPATFLIDLSAAIDRQAIPLLAVSRRKAVVGLLCLSSDRAYLGVLPPLDDVACVECSSPRQTSKYALVTCTAVMLGNF